MKTAYMNLFPPHPAGKAQATVFLFLCFVLMLSIRQAPAQSFTMNCLFVDQGNPAASDSNPGTASLPWRTISHAFVSAQPGDSVVIREGIYHESVATGTGGDTTSGPIVFAACPGEQVIVDGTANAASTAIQILHDYIKLYRLTIRNWASTGIWVYNSGFFEIHGCEVSEVWFGIGISGESHDFLLQDNLIHHFTLYGVDASPAGSAFCYNGRFIRCTAHTGRDPEQNVDGFALGHGQQHGFEFEDCVAYGVYDGFDISASATSLQRCLSYSCNNAGYKLWEDQVTLVNCIANHCAVSAVQVCWVGHPTITTLRNCSFYGAGVYTIWHQDSSSTLNIYNTIIAGGDNIGLCFEQPSAVNYHGDHNLFQNNNALRAINVGWAVEFSLDDLNDGDWTTYSGQDIHSPAIGLASAVFADTGTVNLHLKPTAPAINAATAAWSPPDDFDHLLRPCGPAPDIGAYELQAGGYHTSGNVSGTWQAQDTIFVDGDLVIAVGQSLSIQAAPGGTRVIFTGPYSITVFGRIEITGTSSDSVWLFPLNADSGWHGIRFFNTESNGQDSSRIRYCSFLNAKKTERDQGMGGAFMAQHSSNISLKNSVFRYNQATKGGAVALIGCVPKLSGLVVSENHAETGGGIYFSDGSAGPATDGLLHSNDIHYLGAFRLPDVTTQSSWAYSGSAAAFRADGDSNGPADGYPGSIFASGHDWYFDIGELSIPVPVISPLKDPEDLNTATMLQPMTDITNGSFDTVAVEMIRTGLAWLPPQGAQTSGKVYMCIGQHYQFQPYYSHFWHNDNLADTLQAGPWYFGEIDNYRTDDYMFTIPDAFANTWLGGKKLLTGRYRDGGWSGKGPNLFAFAPWSEGNPPPPLAHLQNISHLVGYTDNDSLYGYKNADAWIGGAWMETDSLSAVAVVGTKALGDCWYGFANGVTFPNDSNYFPPWPYDIRGWWADDFEARILLFSPSDLASVAAGTLEPWEVQPYDSLSIEPFLYNPQHDFGQDQVGSCAYDHENRLLYVFERLGDGDKALVHVFRVGDEGDAPVSQGAVTMNNLLIKNNTALRGGGVALENLTAQPSLVNFTMTGNMASAGGGALYCHSASPQIRNTILWDNHAGTTGHEVFLNNPASDPVISYSDIQGGLAFFGGPGSGSQYNPSNFSNNLDQYPQFENPGSDYRLKAVSPCLNTGDPADTAGNISGSDLEGLPRIHGWAVDMGCYEYQGIPAALNIGNYTTGSGTQGCMAALQTITLAGNGTTVALLTGSHLVFEAGSAIHINTTSAINSGAYAMFRIIPGTGFCANLPANPSCEEITEKTETEDPEDVVNFSGRLKIHPNPATGLIYIELPELPAVVEMQVAIFNTRGDLVHQGSVSDGYCYLADLTAFPPGLYIVRVITVERVYSGKVIR
jgi:hypothetical protein